MNFGFILAYIVAPILISSAYLYGRKYNNHNWVVSSKLTKSSYYIVLSIFTIFNVIHPIPNIKNSIDGLTLNIAIMEGLFGIISHYFEEVNYQVKRKLANK